jgi:hypothetical protein
MQSCLQAVQTNAARARCGLEIRHATHHAVTMPAEPAQQRSSRSWPDASWQRFYACSNWTGRTKARHPKSAPKSDPKIVRPPHADPLFDLLAGQILFQRLLRQRNHFVVRGKTQPDQLVFCQPVDLRMPLRRRQSL